MIKATFLFLLLLGYLPQSHAEVDTTLALFSLETGNFWQYHEQYRYCGTYYSSYFTFEVIGDTVLPNGYSYKILEIDDGYRVLVFLRVDSSSVSIHRFVEWSIPPQDFLHDSLRAGLGDTFMQDGSVMVACDQVDTMTIFGINTGFKSFNVLTPFGTRYKHAYGFGMVERLNFFEDCKPQLVTVEASLVYARIDGIEYGNLVSIDEAPQGHPTEISLHQNYPNPFNPSTTIRFLLPSSADVSLKVFNLLGEEVATLVSGQMETGSHSVQWNATGQPSGVYFYRLQAGDFMETKKLILLR